MKNNEHICIVGAGLVGSLLSIMLAKRGFKVDLIEKRDDLRSANIPGGRTIAMSISSRGWKALEKVNLEKTIRKETTPKFARMVHLDGNTVYSQK
jgi:kynurenine 3-monooxygenase